MMTHVMPDELFSQKDLIEVAIANELNPISRVANRLKRHWNGPWSEMNWLEAANQEGQQALDITGALTRAKALRGGRRNPPIANDDDQLTVDELREALGRQGMPHVTKHIDAIYADIVAHRLVHRGVYKTPSGGIYMWDALQDAFLTFGTTVKLSREAAATGSMERIA